MQHKGANKVGPRSSAAVRPCNIRNIDRRNQFRDHTSRVKNITHSRAVGPVGRGALVGCKYTGATAKHPQIQPVLRVATFPVTGPDVHNLAVNKLNSEINLWENNLYENT